MVTPTLQMRHAAMLVTVEEQKKFLSRPHTLSLSSYRSSHFSKNICSSSLNSFPFFCFFHYLFRMFPYHRSVQCYNAV